MELDETGLDKIQERLLKLEKQNRRMNRIGCAILIVFVFLFGLVMRQQPSPNREIRAEKVTAREFIVADSAVATGSLAALPKASFRIDPSSGEPKLQLVGSGGISTMTPRIVATQQLALAQRSPDPEAQAEVRLFMDVPYGHPVIEFPNAASLLTIRKGEYAMNILPTNVAVEREGRVVWTAPSSLEPLVK